MLRRRGISSVARCFRQPVYPWLLATIPVLHLYSSNYGLVIDHEVLVVLAASLIGTALGYLLARRLLENEHRAAFALSICILLFSIAGHSYLLFYSPRSLLVWSIGIMILAVMLIFIVKRRIAPRKLQEATPSLNLIFAALLTFQIFTLHNEFSKEATYEDVSAALELATGSTDTSPKAFDSKLRPDIYYIVPDGYPSDAWLLGAMGYDNSAFTQALESRGFTIVRHAQSNYGATLHSLASTLNMHYFPENQSPSSDIEYLRSKIAVNEVAQALRSLGYSYVQLLSGYLFPSPIADLNRDFGKSGPLDVNVTERGYSISIMTNEHTGLKINERKISTFVQQSFASLYMDTTLLRIVKSQARELTAFSPFTLFDIHAPERFLATVEDVKSIAAMPEATFALIHLMKPHGPVVFDAEGNVIEEVYVPDKATYFAEFEYTNAVFLDLIDQILDDSTTEPIIVFQADHGTTLGDIWSDEDRLTHFDTYAAYYLPDENSITFPKPYTLINSFTLVLNELFDLDFPMNENRLFEVLKGYDAPFEQRDVTDEFANW